MSVAGNDAVWELKDLENTQSLFGFVTLGKFLGDIVEEINMS